MANPKKPYHLTGGLQWHFTALRRGSTWADLRLWVQSLILQKPSPPQGLLIAGASAGWTLPQPLPACYNPVLGVDMDPLAPLFFRLRHGGHGRQIQWMRADFMDQLDHLLIKVPQATVLFANTLGQQGFLEGLDDGLEVRLAQLQHRLAGRRWLSYHDRLSFKVADAQAGVALTRHLQARLAAIHALPPTSQSNSSTLLQALDLPGFAAADKRPLKVLDHRTALVLPANQPKSYCLWAIRPHQIHLLEGGWGVSD